MTIPREILSSVVDQMRSSRKQGDTVSTILNRLWPAKDSLDILGHLRIAFCSELPNFRMLSQEDDGRPSPEPVDRMLGQRIDEARPLWENAPPYPDLYRRSHRHAFRAVASARILVGSVERNAAQYVGRAGFRPCPPELRGLPRAKSPSAGLLSADPTETQLLEWMKKNEISHEDYCAGIRAAGFGISGKESGCLIRDNVNNAFYPGYNLQGVYSQEHGRNLWQGRVADEIRFELNQRMGEELVQRGPNDLIARSESRFATRPLVPVIIFEPDGNVSVQQTISSLRAYYGNRNLPWDRLYGEVSA
jgi:hypothetical protein